MHPHTELRFINEFLGYGVFATQFIPKGTIVWILDDLDQKFDPNDVAALDPIARERLIKYSYRDQQGRYILCWDIARYVNHSFNASCVATPYRFELATRNLVPGDELTDDYGYFNLDKPFFCFPEPGCDRTQVLPEDFLHCYPQWDQQATEAMSQFNQVAQPLQHLIEQQFRAKVTAIANGKAEMDSLLSCYYDPKTELKGDRALNRHSADNKIRQSAG